MSCVANMITQKQLTNDKGGKKREKKEEKEEHPLFTTNSAQPSPAKPSKNDTQRKTPASISYGGGKTLRR